MAAIWRVRGKVWWAKRRRKIVRRDNGKEVEFEEGKYGMLMMVLCDREGRVYDVWITFGSVHEVRAEYSPCENLAKGWAIEGRRSAEAN